MRTTANTKTRSRLRIALRSGTVATLLAAATLTGMGPALATPAGPGVSGTILSQTTIGKTDYILREITIPPGQATGWHWHAGQLYGLVKKGTLSHFDSTCASDGVYRRGSVIQEPSGDNNVHIGVNRGTTPVVLQVLYVLPTGSALSQDAPNPGCSFQ